MKDLRERLVQSPPILADGAMGSLLQSAGHAGCLERLNLDEPDAVKRVHADYLAAGAEILWTNSFGGSPRRLAAGGLADRTEEVNEAAARIARDVAGESAWVAGSVGPCGVPLAPYGDLDPDELTQGVARQVRGLAAGGVDVVVVETMMDAEEAVVALRAARDVAPGLPVFVTLTFTETPAGLFTPFGTSPADAVRRLADEGADAIGANCGTGPEPMLEVAREMAQATERPRLFKPNAGMPEVTDAGPTWPETPETFAANLAEITASGAAIVGGCCGTTPAHIEAARGALGELG
ncbi:MAG: homocysteine S-methyltransferase family protein [Planctomycetota bacterium]